MASPAHHSETGPVGANQGLLFAPYAGNDARRNFPNGFRFLPATGLACSSRGPLGAAADHVMRSAAAPLSSDHVSHVTASNCVRALVGYEHKLERMSCGNKSRVEIQQIRCRK